LGWFNDVASAVVGDLLEQWPSLQDLQQVKPAKLEKFLREHHCAEIPERLLQIRQAIPATHDRALLDSAPYLVAVWVRQMAVLWESIRQLEKCIAAQAAQQEDWHIFQSLPGAGAALAPRLMVALGTQRDRYSSASDAQSFSGIAPVKEASGNTQWVHFRKACPKFLRPTFHEWADVATLYPVETWTDGRSGLTGKDLVAAVIRGEDIRIGADGFRLTEKQNTSGIERILEHRQGLLLQGRPI
jgi:hypothetical protein